MALIRGSARYLLVEAQAGRLHQLLSEQARHQWEHQVGVGEVLSWMRSLPPLLTELVDAGLGDVEVLLEHKLQHSPKRVDVILRGEHPRTSEPSYVLVELKQWSKAELLAADLVSVAAYAEPVLHPVEQVRAYCQYLVDSTPSLAEWPQAVHGLAYLHNAKSADIPSLMQYRPDRFGRLFTEDYKSDLVDHLRALLDVNGGRDHARDSADEFLRLEHGPSKPLLQLAAEEIQDREQFVLLDEQRVAYKLVERAVATARAARTQTVVVVLGGPGSGKSVIALSLLGELSRQGRKVHHATGSSAFTNTMRKVAGSRNTRVKTMFKYFNNYVGSEPRELDVLICDEAHRVRETSVNHWTGKEKRALARRQIDELIDVAWVPVFLLDENQIVRPGEMGSLDEITAAANATGCKVEVVRLDGQFRCGGSDAFDEWVRRLLGLDPQPPISWSRLTAGTDDDFRVAAAASPAAMEAWVLYQREQHGGTARLAAGYCWPWSDPVGAAGSKHLVDDVVIDNWKRPWNAKPEKRVPDAPESYYWASDDRGFRQVGCIYTAQGFEYDWSGVIFGPDFVRRGDRWVARRECSHDPAVKKAEEAHFGALIRNTYKVLLTRGMEGTCVYSTDPETQEFLEKMTR
ncbi:DNA/RNA helicase domain-containing protein [Nocardia sp. NPDC127526]|uniref:DNA/RNA helicase domain-containing protein n=1 Tax=Nocardia sp. NPDC127526 TaxID=3345393 RepID=UPI0036456709